MDQNKTGTKWSHSSPVCSPVCTQKYSYLVHMDERNQQRWYISSSRRPRLVAEWQTKFLLIIGPCQTPVKRIGNNLNDYTKNFSICEIVLQEVIAPAKIIYATNRPNVSSLRPSRLYRTIVVFVQIQMSLLWSYYRKWSCTKGQTKCSTAQTIFLQIDEMIVYSSKTKSS